MNISISKYYWICIFLCAPFFIKAQDCNALQAKADTAFSRGDFITAELHYEKIFFLSNDVDVKVLARVKRSYCLKHSGQSLRAIEILDEVLPTAMSDSVRYLVLYEKALNSFLIQNYSEAVSVLEQLDVLIPDSLKENDFYLLRALSFNNTYEWDKAQEMSQQWLHRTFNNPDSFESRMNELVNFYEHSVPRIKKPFRAFSYSTIIPGTGQLYAGYPGEAALSFAICAGLLAGSAYIIIWQHYWLTGWLGGLSLFNRFYNGGKARAEYLARAHNAIKMEQFNRNYLKIVKP